jgi:phenylpropionate dioxygenase-like ring-hydroxylating dioxygenase large terminal subunit
MSQQRTRAEAGSALFDHVCGNTTQQTASVLSIPAEEFVDEGRWKLEIERIFKKLPLILAWSAELSAPGAYKTLEIMGLPLLISRGADGLVRVFLNSCTHRGAQLTGQERGNCNRFTCPYHGWTYATDGRLIGVADKAGFGEFNHQERGLRSLPCVERAGLVFAVLTPDAPLNVEEFYGGMLTEIESFNLQDWSWCGSRELPGPNWKIAFDGYIENYHFATTHRTTLAPYFISGVMTFDTFGPHVRVGAPSASILASMGSAPREEWQNYENNGYEFVRSIFPNVTISVLPEHVVYLTQIFPGNTPGESITLLSFLRQRPPQDEEEHRRMTEIMDVTLNILRTEDYPTNFGVQKSLQSGLLDSVIFGRNEAANQFFHRCTEYYLQEQPEGPLPVL